MYNEIVISRLYTCLEHIEAIEKYFNEIQKEDTTGLKFELHFDAILMRLQALGENLKRILIKHPFVITDLNYSEINDVIRFRDYVSHHYEQLETELVLNICQVKIPELKQCISKLLK